MTKADQLKQLERVAGLLFDSKLTDLQRAARACADTKARLDGLAALAAPDGDLPQVAAELAALNYQRWADVRRTELNQILARQTAVWSDARDAARLAFGKTEALAGVAAKVASITRSKR